MHKVTLDDLQNLIDNNLIFGTTSVATSSEPIVKGTVLGRLFQVAAVGLLGGLNWLWDNVCSLAWLLILILLGIIAWLLYRLRVLNQEVNNLKNGGLHTDHRAIGLVDLSDLAGTENDDMEDMVSEDSWQEYSDGVEAGGAESADEVQGGYAVDPAMAPLPIIEAGDEGYEESADDEMEVK